jgi:hypothetical protein
VSFLLGVAWLCLGADAPTEAQEIQDPGQQTQAPVEETAAAEDADAPTPRAVAKNGPRFLAEYAPPAIEGPGLRLAEPMTRLYVDGSYGRTDDLSGLPLIAGSAHNYRFAVGGSLRWHRFSFDGEITFSNITTIDVTEVPGGQPIDQDRHQTATSLGDTRLGFTWTTPLTDSGAVVGGFGVRLRLPTHTVVFQFHLVDMVTLGKYLFPYYFHVEPTLILGGSAGRFSFIVNEGLLLMTGPDGNFQNVHITVPNLLFWSAHYAVVYSPFQVLALSVDLGTDVQLNHVTVMDFEKVNDLVAVSLNVGLQVHIDRYRVDLVGRRGLTHDSELFGVLQYAGTQSLTLRFGRIFD